MLYDPKWKPPVEKRPQIKAQGLTKREIKYLLKVLALLKDGTIKDYERNSKSSMKFLMSSFTNYEYDDFGMRCGTSGCIAGWMETLEQIDKGVPINSVNPYVGKTWDLLPKKKFRHLFYASYWIMNIAKTEDGIRAIENFLFKGSKRPWNFMYRKYPKGERGENLAI